MSRWAWLLGTGCVLGVAACGGHAFTSAAPDAISGTTGAEDGAAHVDDAPEDDAADAFDAADAADATVDASAVDTGAALEPSDAEWRPDALEPAPAQCQGAFACTAAAPAGWSGPLELYAQSGDAPECGAHFEGPVYDGHSGLTADPATCSCQCESPTDVTCSAPVLTFFVNRGAGAACTVANECAAAKLTPGMCEHVDVLAACDAGAELRTTVSARFAASTASGGSCAPLATTAVGTPAWAINARACVSSLGTAASDCASGSVCAPRPAGAFTSLCVARAGDVACPSNAYTVKHLYHQNVVDTRDCSACTCGDPTGATCAADFQVPTAADAGACSAPFVEYSTPGCSSFFQQPADVRLIVSSTGGACSPSSVGPTGSVLPAGPTTFCCLP